MKRKINILQVTFGMGIGGMERVIQTLCRCIDKEVYTIRVFCLNLKGELASELENDGIQVFCPSKQSKLDRYLRAREITKVIREHNIDILHTHHTPAFFDGFIATRFAKVPVFVNTDHCKKYPAPNRFMVIERFAAKYVDRIVAVSNHTKNDLVTYEHIPGDKIDVIYNGIDFPNLDGQLDKIAMRKEFGIKDNELVVGCVSRLDEQKGYDLFVDAAALILKEMPNIRFLIVGGGTKEKELKKQAKDLGVDDRITFTGWRLDASRILQLFDVFLLTSNFEGMPIVILEAMASGKPIVATPVGGIPEVVDHGRTGFIAQPRDPRVVAKHVLSIIKDEELRNTLKENSIVDYKNRFRAETMVEAYRRLYESILLKKGFNGFFNKAREIH